MSMCPQRQGGCGGGGGGWDSCQYHGKDDRLMGDRVRVDQFRPDEFRYDTHRYQIFAKPMSFNCQTRSNNVGGNEQPLGAGGYIPAHTDVRALQQSMYIPIVPSNPGGQTDTTFPMTPQTMGHPDVTSACCVPVIPSQPGYKNLTADILPGPCQQLNRQRGMASPAFGGGCSSCQGTGGYGGCAPQTIRAPSNTPGGGCLGLPDTFPMQQQQQHPMNSGGCSYAAGMSHPPPFQAPHYTGAMPNRGGQFGGGFGGGFAPEFGFPDDLADGLMYGKECTNVKALRHEDIAARAVIFRAETPHEKGRRLSSMYGSFGSNLTARPINKRHLAGPRSHLKTQGNGFQFSNPPVAPNQECYVLERNAL